MTGFEGLRVLLVGPLPPPAGGMANQTRQLAGLLQDAGASVTLVQTNRPYWPAWIGKVPMLRAAFRLLPYALSLWREAGRADVCHVMANSGWSWHLFAAPAIHIAHWRRLPVVVNYRGGEAEAFLARAGTVVRHTMRRAAVLAVPSGFLQSVFERHGMAACIVPNVVNLERFRPAEARVHGAHVVVARNLEPLYDNATALRALALLRRTCPQATMTVAGTGSEASSLAEMARALGIADAVHFAGRLSPDEMAALYRRADLCLNPSLADNMPNSILEALASGVPVVSTRVGGVPYLVRDGITALLVPAGDAEAMAEAMARVLCDDALRRSLVSAGLQEVQRYTWQRVAPLLADSYQAARRTGRAAPARA
jgi:glycosyltransferase involved in cell wall biosynthesis